MTGDSQAPESFHEALARIKGEAAAQPEADRLGYIKGAVANCTSLHPADRSAIFDLLMQVPSMISTGGHVTLNQNFQQNQTASPTITQSQTVNAPSETSPSSKKGGGVVLAAVITAIGGIIVALIAARFTIKPAETATLKKQGVTTKAPRPRQPVQRENGTPGKQAPTGAASDSVKR